MFFTDWIKLQKIVNDNPNSKIVAGLSGDWDWTSCRIYEKGTYYQNRIYQGSSTWAAPVAMIDDKEEIPCYYVGEHSISKSDVPDWWGSPNAAIELTKDIVKWALKEGCFTFEVNKKRNFGVNCKFQDYEIELSSAGATIAETVGEYLDSLPDVALVGDIYDSILDFHYDDCQRALLEYYNEKEAVKTAVFEKVN